MQVVYQMNIDRSNKLYDFEPGRLDFSELNAGAAPSLSNRYYSVIDSDPACGRLRPLPLVRS